MPYRVADYSEPVYFTPKINLEFNLEPHATLVTAELDFELNSSVTTALPHIELNGHKDLIIKKLYINGIELNDNDYQIVDDGDYVKLVIPNRYGKKFQFKQIVELKPATNHRNQGLYMSDGGFVTQNESTGFRTIIFSIDRPDNLSVYTVTIQADKTQYPILLSNGNQEGDYEQLPDNCHRVTYVDEFLKPSYLFALCAGQYNSVERKYMTNILGCLKMLRIYGPMTEPRENMEFAKDVTYQMMVWNETEYRLELDLDEYKIVGVSTFNMGAMENKGLNIFSSAAVFADPMYSTDFEYKRILSIISHEIAHNWAGNRVTLRDWSQLSLKEGLAVYIEQQFSSEKLGGIIRRIEDIDYLRRYQFPEDAGSLAHPVHPEEYDSIENFYTTTIYAKGAELLTTLAELLGKQTFFLGIKKYFEKFDGKAATIEDFIKTLEEESKHDLSQFRYWYKFAGTPELTITDSYNEKEQTYSLTITQQCPVTPNQTAEKPPFLIPIKIGLFDDNGAELKFKLLDDEKKTAVTSIVLELTQRTQTFTFTGITAKPTPSLLRNFTAPVKIVSDPLDFAGNARLITYDTDAYVRWDRMQTLFKQEILKQLEREQQGKEIEISSEFYALFEQLIANIANDDIAADFKTALLTVPSHEYIATLTSDTDPQVIHNVIATFKKLLALKNEEKLHALLSALEVDSDIDKSFSLEQPEVMKKRGLYLWALDLLCYTHKTKYTNKALVTAREKQNFTNVYLAYLAYFRSQGKSLLLVDHPVIKELYAKYKENPKLLLKWLELQAVTPALDALDNFENIITGKIPGFNVKDPSHYYNFVTRFMMFNPRFHDASGRGYKLVADLIMRLDTEIKNGSVAARVAKDLIPSSNIAGVLQQKMYEELYRISQNKEISVTLKEVITKGLGNWQPKPQGRFKRFFFTCAAFIKIFFHTALSALQYIFKIIVDGFIKIFNFVNIFKTRGNETAAPQSEFPALVVTDTADLLVKRADHSQSVAVITGQTAETGPAQNIDRLSSQEAQSTKREAARIGT